MYECYVAAPCFLEHDTRASGSAVWMLILLLVVVLVVMYDVVCG